MKPSLKLKFKKLKFLENNSQNIFRGKLKQQKVGSKVSVMSLTMFSSNTFHSSFSYGMLFQISLTLRESCP